MKPAAVALVVVAGLALASTLAHFKAQQVDVDQAASGDGAAPYDNPWAAFDVYGMGAAAIEEIQVHNAIADTSTDGANLAAFLAMIRVSEGTARARDPYRVCYSYRHTIEDLSDHPAVTGEWKGESIANLGPQYAGMVSTAAGAYQIIRKTWLTCRRALGLTDFSPASQDAACVYLIKGRRALDDVQAGRIEDAISKCRPEWASLPGGNSGQPQRRLDDLMLAFNNAGGVLA